MVDIVVVIINAVIGEAVEEDINNGIEIQMLLDLFINLVKKDSENHLLKLEVIGL
jgi:hypothetical protein